MIFPYLNLGLLHPLEVIQTAFTAYLDNNLNLNSVEGFIRQIMGWREYIRGVYFYVDADYFQKYWFNLRCCTILNYLLRNRLSGLFHKR